MDVAPAPEGHALALPNRKPALLTSIYEDVHLLPAFLEHYHSSGFGRVHIVTNQHVNKDLWDQVNTLVVNSPLPVVLEGPCDVAQSHVTKELNAIRRRHVGSHEYFAVADLDEFIEYPGPIEAVIDQCRREGAVWMLGEFLDRVTADGNIPPHVGSDIWTQFPLGGKVGKVLHGGSERKCVLQRGDQSITVGHHGKGANRKAATRVATVHHFKWCGDLVARLQRRVEIDRVRGEPFWAESQQILDHLHAHNGCIAVREQRFGLKLHAPPTATSEKMLPHQSTSKIPGNATVSTLG